MPFLKPDLGWPFLVLLGLSLQVPFFSLTLSAFDAYPDPFAYALCFQSPLCLI